MRTGAIFARGSCRALKWMALVGVVFALGVGSVAAQQTLSGGAVEIEVNDSTEGQSTDIKVTVSAEVTSVAADSGSKTTVTVTVSAATLSAADATALGVTPAEYNSATAGQPDDYALGTGDTVELKFVFPEEERTPVGRSFPHTLAAQTVELQTRNHDDDAEDEGLRVTATPAAELTGASAVNDDVKIMDDEDQTYVLALDPATQKPEEGDSVTVSLKAEPAHVQTSELLTINIDKPSPDYGFSIAVETGSEAAVTGNNQVRIGVDPDTATNAVTTATITLTTPANDANRVDDTVMMSAHSGQPGAGVREDALPIVLADKNMLPTITAALVLLDADGMPVMDGEVTDGMVTEGMDYELTLTVVDEDGDAMEAGEDLTIALTASGTASANDDYSLATNMVTIAMGAESSEAIKLEVDLNDDLNDESLMFGYRVSGESMYGTETSPPAGMDPASLLALTIVDDTSRLVTVATGAMEAIYGAINMAKGDNGQLNRGARVLIPKSALFTAMTGYTVEIAPDTSDPSVANVYDGDDATNNPASDWPGNLVIFARETGTATITLTGTAVSASGFQATQLSVDAAEIKFEVTVELAVPPMVTGLEADPGDGYVTLSWNGLSSNYEVTRYEYDVDASDSWTSAGTSTSVTVSGLTNGTRYVFRVRAVNEAGNGAPTAGVGATPEATPVDASQVVTVKSVSAATSVAESGGLEVTVTANVPAGTKGADGKVAAIASKRVMVSFPTTDIAAAEKAEASDTTLLGATNGGYTWTNIARKEEKSEATYKFRVAIGQDLDAEDEKFLVEVMIDGDAVKSKVVTIDDAQEQKYTLSLPAAAKGAITEGKSGTLTLKADPKRTIDIPVTLALEPNDPSRYSLSVTNGTFGTTSLETTVSAKSDSNRADDTLTVTAYTDLHGEFASIDITIKDANALPAVKATLVDKDGKALDPQPESVMEGETVKVMLTAVDKDGKAMKAAEKLTVTLMPTGSADVQDYRLSSSSFEIAKDKESSAAVDLMITEDQDIGEETLMFDAAVAGEAKNGTEKRSVAGVLSLMIMDGTQKLVWANSQEEVEAAVYAAKNAGAGDDMMFTAGEMIEVMGGLLFSSAEGVSVSYTADSDMSDVASVSVSGGTVMVKAEGEGMAHITITAHGSMPSGVKILDQSDPGMASIMFPVEVGLEALSIELKLKDPEDMNLAEGMSAEVTATANRAVTADTMVMLMRDRAMSSASDDDFMAEAITIAAGDMMGSTMVMAVEDNMMEDMEELVLYGMTEGMAGEVTGEVHLHLWDAAVPALPIIAQLLLAAFLAFGGYRRYRRR